MNYSFCYCLERKALIILKDNYMKQATENLMGDRESSLHANPNAFSILWLALSLIMFSEFIMSLKCKIIISE